MKPTLEDLRLSAEACGYGVRVAKDFDGTEHVIYGKKTATAVTMEITSLAVWNPPENPAQDAECRDELLRRQVSVSYGVSDKFHYARDSRLYLETIIYSAPAKDCDAKDFACLALAEVMRREK